MDIKERGYIEQIPDLPVLYVMAAADAGYLYPAMVLFVSLFHNHRRQRVEVFFFHSGLSRGEIAELCSLEERWEGKKITCMEITQEQLHGLRDFGRFSVVTFYRILGMGMIPGSVKRILYLDVDMVVNSSLSDLFTMEMDQPLGACYDINNELQGNIDHHKSVIGIPVQSPYFNAGMLLLDMDYIRDHHVKDILLTDVVQNFDSYELVDQDALNKFFCGKTRYLPWEKYNCPCVPYLVRRLPERGLPDTFLSYQEALGKENGRTDGYDVTNAVIQRAAVIHFCTSQKPWRDREFYQKENMREARKIYNRYEKMLGRMLPGRQAGSAVNQCH